MPIADLAEGGTLGRRDGATEDSGAQICHPARPPSALPRVAPAPTNPSGKSHARGLRSTATEVESRANDVIFLAKIRRGTQRINLLLGPGFVESMRSERGSTRREPGTAAAAPPFESVWLAAHNGKRARWYPAGHG